MDTTMIQRTLMAVITMLTITAILILTHTSTPNCNDPHTWSTASGVQACAITEEN